jgi:hypothetical protein
MHINPDGASVRQQIAGRFRQSDLNIVGADRDPFDEALDSLALLSSCKSHPLSLLRLGEHFAKRAPDQRFDRFGWHPANRPALSVAPATQPG